MSVRLFALVAALAFVVTSAGAEPRQHGNLIYDLPPDWSAGVIENGTQLLLYNGPEERCQFCYIHLGPGAAARGDLAAWLAAQSPHLVDPEDRASIEVVQAAQVAGTNPRPFAMTAFRADDDIYVAFGLEAGGRYELLGFQGWAYDQDEIQRSFAFLQQEVTPLLDQLQFVSEGAQPLLPEAVPGSLSGLWWGWWLMPTMQLDMTMQMTMDHRHLVFWPDGRFYEGTPPTGLMPLDPDAMALSPDPNWGIYREKRGTLELHFVDGQTETLTADGDGWSDGNRTLHRVEPLPNGTPLSGTVSSFFYTGFTPGSGLEGGISSSSSTTFFADGTYAGESFGGAFSNFTDGAGGLTGGFATDNGTTATGGTYKVRDGLVLMRPNDGSGPRAELVFRADNGEILIGDQALEAE